MTQLGGDPLPDEASSVSASAASVSASSVAAGEGKGDGEGVGAGEGSADGEAEAGAGAGELGAVAFPAPGHVHEVVRLRRSEDPGRVLSTSMVLALRS